MWMFRARLLATLMLALSVLSPCARAEGLSPATVELEALTWTELRDRIATGTTTVLIPIGGTEQSGPAIALGKHNVRVHVLADRIAAGLGRTLVAPVIAYVPEGGVSPPTSHMRFPGTITIPEATFESTLEYAARSLRVHGFRDIVLLGDHGGYQKSLQRVADRLNREWASSPVRVHALLAYYEAADSGFAALLEQEGYSRAEIGTHAGVADTSLAMAVDPALVRTDRVQRDKFTPAQGVYGDPRRSNARVGQRGADLIVQRSIDALRQQLARR